MFNSVWYDNLVKPFLNPPSQIFPVVWGILYTLILAAFIIYVIKPSFRKGRGYLYFFIQLILNLLWSPAFFYFKNIGLALIIIIFLDIFVFLTIRKFYTVEKFAGILLMPYFIWILFATYLNTAFYILN